MERLDRIEQRARHPIERAESGEHASGHELEQAQNEFRYQRNLLAADDLEAWLGSWGVSVQDWLEQVRGALHRRRTPSASPAGGEADQAELEAAAWAEGVCSGELDLLARKLAERFAVDDADQPAELTAAGLSRMDDAHRRFCEAAVTGDALERRLEDERLEWTRIDGRYLAHRDEDVVREAALGVREEGRDLEEMARMAGARYEPATHFYLADARRRSQGTSAGREPPGSSAARSSHARSTGWWRSAREYPPPSRIPSYAHARRRRWSRGLWSRPCYEPCAGTPSLHP